MQKAKIFTGTHYKKPIHHINVFKNNNKLPITEKIGKEIITIPIHPNLSESQVKKIIDNVNSLTK